MDLTISQSILQDRKIVYALTDRNLKVVEVGGSPDVLHNSHDSWVGCSLLELMPELIGSEGALTDILNGELPRFQLSCINRETADKTGYLTVVCLPYRSSTGQITGLIHLVEDVTEMGLLEQQAVQQRNKLYLLRDRLLRQQTELETANAKLKHIALHDGLTGLPNRVLFMERLERSVRRAKEQRGYLSALLFLDLDRFKVINDSLGHTVGDELLVAVARRLEACVRAEDTVARLGGDEFAILLDDIKDIEYTRRVAERIQNELASPVKLQGQKLFVTASVGIVFNLTEYERPADLLRDADMTMYRAKALGKARYEMFDNSMYTQAITRLQMETDLRRAIERQEFRLYYQPFVSLGSGQIVGVEALLRWHHPERGLVLPEEFIPLAEETELIHPIGTWVLRAACAQVKAWHRAGYPHLRLAINISTRQLQKAGLVELVEETLSESGLDARALEMEMTESAAVRDGDVATLGELRDLGVRISLDDFGLGSSLDCLKRLPLNVLKIDRFFVRDLAGDAGSEAITAAVISMSHNLNFKVIAEGVETKEQLAFLRAERCDEVQGNLFSEPVPAEMLTKLLEVGSFYGTDQRITD